MSFKVIITSDFNHMSEAASEIITNDVREKQAGKNEYVIGLATGNSPTGLYKHLAKAANSGAFNPSRMRSFNLDEYVGLPGENAQQRVLHPESYSSFMVRELFGLLQKQFMEVNVPWGTIIDQDTFMAELEAHPDDWEMQGADKGKAVVIRKDAGSEYLRMIKSEILDAYERKIEASGGIDLQVVGVGGRGHVGFHEAGIPFEGNGMLLVELDENTVSNAVKDGHFARIEDSPSYAVSMGAELIYKAGTVLLLASGGRKAEPVAESLLMDPDCSIPISYGRVLSNNGGRMIYVIDKAAAEIVLHKVDNIRRLGVEVEDISDRGAAVRVEELLFSRNPETGLMG